MQFLLLIYEDEKRTGREPAEYAAFDERHAGVITCGHALQPTSAAKTVRIRNGQGTIWIGPYVEGNEQLRGFYVIEADSVDVAASIAAGIPAARHGVIEVRPILAASSAVQA